ncbi:MAG: hypothetical protein IKP47_02520 [Ruminococcus sp.]|nr:hypothetical protein [Ruminococcus sp.]
MCQLCARLLFLTALLRLILHRLLLPGFLLIRLLLLPGFLLHRLLLPAFLLHRLLLIRLLLHRLLLIRLLLHRLLLTRLQILGRRGHLIIDGSYDLFPCQNSESAEQPLRRRRTQNEHERKQP